MKEATLPLGPPLGPGVDISVLCIPLRARVGHLGSLQEPSSMRKNPYDTQRDSSCSCLRQGRSSRVMKGAQELASKARQAERDLMGGSLLLLPCVLGSEVVATGSEP